jgi:hypothetical protein
MMANEPKKALTETLKYLCEKYPDSVVDTSGNPSAGYLRKLKIRIDNVARFKKESVSVNYSLNLCFLWSQSAR